MRLLSLHIGTGFLHHIAIRVRKHPIYVSRTWATFVLLPFFSLFFFLLSGKGFQKGRTYTRFGRLGWVYKVFLGYAGQHLE